MDEAEYEAWATRKVGEYAADHAKSDGTTVEDALERARQEFATLLPAGLRSPNMHLLRACDADSGEPVGLLWLAERGAAGRRQAFIYDIEVHPGLRGRGYGRALLTAAEDEARRLGLARISLHVFGHNTAAIRLYETSGFAVTNLLMAKELPAK